MHFCIFIDFLIPKMSIITHWDKPHFFCPKIEFRSKCEFSIFFTILKSKSWFQARKFKYLHFFYFLKASFLAQNSNYWFGKFSSKVPVRITAEDFWLKIPPYENENTEWNKSNGPSQCNQKVTINFVPPCSSLHSHCCKTKSFWVIF